MSDVVIRVENLSKKYTIWHRNGQGDGLRHAIHGMATAPLRWLRQQGANHNSNGNGRAGHAAPNKLEEFHALKDVSFEVNRGEVVGIIGGNGAGKSTLLKILSRITEPTDGRVRIKGRVASLLEVGTGFHPELTGKENIFLNGAILGMTRQEIKHKFDEIVAFAEIEKFLDTPVKRYSSGMYVRLAFAVAAHLDPEILLVDEVLAVGDAAFQKKCLSKVSQVSTDGRTVLIVSHNMAIIQKLCGSAACLKEGRIICFGNAGHVITGYLAESAQEAFGAVVNASNHPNRLRSMKPLLKLVSLHATNGEPKTEFLQGEPILVVLQYDCDKFDVMLAGAGFNLETDAGQRVGSFNSYMAHEPPHRLPSKGTLEFLIRKPYLNPGKYWFNVSLGSHPNMLEDKVERVMTFDVYGADIYGTGYLLTPENGVAALECDFRVAQAGLH